MECSDFCLKCQKLELLDIEKLFWDNYFKKDILKTVLYCNEFLNNDFPASSKENLINQLQDLYKDQCFEHFFSRKGMMEPWMEEEEIAHKYLCLYLIQINKKMITLESLCNLTPKGFEKFIFNIFKYLGYSNVKITRHTKDGGFDISATKDGVFYLAECKKYHPNNNNGVRSISRLADAMHRKRAQRGIFITTSSFTKDCYKEQKERDIEIEFWNGKYLMNLIRNELNLVFFEYNN